MRLDTIKLPTGYSLKQVRDHCRELRRHAMYTDSFSRETIASVFGKNVTRELLRKGLIEPARKHYFTRQRGDYYGGIDPGRYRLSNIGHRLTTVSLVPPITRARGDQILADFIKRFHAINQDPNALFRVTKVTLFGSYLTKKSMIGDVDIDYEYEAAFEPYELWKEAAVAYARLKAPHRYFYLAYDEVDYVKNEFRRTLKNRVRNLHLSQGQLRRMPRIRRKQVIFEQSANGR